MKRGLICLALTLAVTFATTATAGPKLPDPNDPVPLPCAADASLTTTVNTRVNGKAESGRLALLSKVSCNHDELSMSVSTALTKDGIRLAAPTAASCSFGSPDFSCADLSAAGNVMIPRRLAGTYVLQTTLTTHGNSWLAVSLFAQPATTIRGCTAADQTWTAVTCASSRTFIVT